MNGVAGIDLTQAPTAAQFALPGNDWGNIEQAAAQLLAAWAEHHAATVLNVSSLALAPLPRPPASNHTASLTPSIVV